MVPVAWSRVSTICRHAPLLIVLIDWAPKVLPFETAIFPVALIQPQKMSLAPPLCSTPVTPGADHGVLLPVCVVLIQKAKEAVPDSWSLSP